MRPAAADFGSFWNVIDLSSLGLLLVSTLPFQFLAPFADCAPLYNDDAVVADVDAVTGSIAGRVLRTHSGGGGDDDDGGGGHAAGIHKAAGASSFENISMVLFGFAALPLCLRLLRICTNDQKLGVLIIIMAHMTADIANFMVRARHRPMVVLLLAPLPRRHHDPPKYGRCWRA